MAELPILKKKRGPVRALISKNIKDAEQAAENKDFATFDTKVFSLKLKGEELSKMDSDIMDLLVVTDILEDDLNKEVETAQQYQEQIYQCCMLASIFDVKPAASVRSERENSIKFPKLELRAFDGDLAQWLGWWSQFETIDSSDLRGSEKFQYLLQATHGKALELVSGFPPTDENYPKAISALKERFGNSDILGEMYTRELLALCFRQTKEKHDVQFIHDKVETSLRALESLKINMEECSPVLTPLVESTLPDETLRTFRRSMSAEQQSSKDRLKALLGFLKKEIETEQRLSLAMEGFGVKTNKPKTERSAKQAESQPTAYSLHTAMSRRDGECLFCSIKGHNAIECRKAKSMTLEERKDRLGRAGACFRCLDLHHRSMDCKASLSCGGCSRRHATIMCWAKNDKNDENQGKETKDNRKRGKESPRVSNNGQKGKDGSEKQEEKQTHQHCHISSSDVATETILPTLRVTVRGRWGQIRKVRAMIDSASQRTYLLEEVASKLSLPVAGVERVAHTLFEGERTKDKSYNCYTVTVVGDGGKLWDFEALGTTVISDYRGVSKLWKQGLLDQGIEVDASNGPVELLIGADYFGQLLTGRKISIADKLVAWETELGWTISGVAGPSRSSQSDVYCHHTTISSEPTEEITNLWRLEAVGIMDPGTQVTKDERQKRTLDHFQEHVRFINNRYEVALPWKEADLLPPTYRDAAERRLRAMTARLHSNGLYGEYNAIIQDWLAAGIIEHAEDDNSGHYLAHRPVVKTSSLTTRVRPIFDASAKQRGNPSLNDCLEEGVNFIEELPSVLLRFREGKFGVVADVKKAFLQISMRAEDRHFLKFLWWKEDGTVGALRHARVVFGLKPSPFLLCAVMQHHLSLQDGHVQRDQLEKLKKGFYVDDLVTSTNTAAELTEFKEVAQEALAGASMDLRGWEYTGSGVAGEDTRVLGIQWDRHDDSLGVNLEWWEEEGGEKACATVTKRQVLSLAQRTFDPLGMVVPVTLFPKLLLQQLWEAKIGWYDDIDSEIKKEFGTWRDSLTLLKEIRIPRWLHGHGDKTLHVFCDASIKAYAAVVFVRTDREGDVSVRFVLGKNRVASKGLTIQRLELMAATIGSRLLNNVKKALQWNDPIFLWSDSATVVQWITRKEEWSVFVRNRVQEIRETIGDGHVRHVPGLQNPADLPSRGCTTAQLLASQWWEGPLWLRDGEDAWPGAKPAEVDEEEISQERLKTCRIHVTTAEPDDGRWWQRFSRFKSIVRLVGWMLRFVDNSRRQSKGLQQTTGELSLSELQAAERVIFRTVQKDLRGKRMDWPLGRVEEVLPGRDGVGRTVRLRTSRGQLLRPIQRVYPLELDSDESKEEAFPLTAPDATIQSEDPPVANELDPDTATEVTSPPTTPAKISRRGRAIRVPNKLEDYEL